MPKASHSYCTEVLPVTFSALFKDVLLLPRRLFLGPAPRLERPEQHSVPCLHLRYLRLDPDAFTPSRLPVLSKLLSAKCSSTLLIVVAQYSYTLSGRGQGDQLFSSTRIHLPSTRLVVRLAAFDAPQWDLGFSRSTDGSFPITGYCGSASRSAKQHDGHHDPGRKMHGLLVSEIHGRGKYVLRLKST